MNNNYFEWNIGLSDNPKTRSLFWYVAFVAVSLLVVVLAWIISGGSIVAVIATLFAAIFLLYSYSFKSKEYTYAIDQQFIYINSKKIPIARFKSYNIVNADNPDQLVVILYPAKRFDYITALNFYKSDIENIQNSLQNLPLNETKSDIIDRLFNKFNR